MVARLSPLPFCICDKRRRESGELVPWRALSKDSMDLFSPISVEAHLRKALPMLEFEFEVSTVIDVGPIQFGCVCLLGTDISLDLSDQRILDFWR